MSLCRRSSVLLLLFTVFTASLPSVPAFAKGKKESDEARRERSEGTVALNLGRYDDAAEHFEEAYGLSQDPILLFYLGQAYRLGGKPEKALSAYNAFLRSSSPSSKNREQFERAAADIELIATILVKRGASAQPQENPVEKLPPAAATANKPAGKSEESLEPTPVAGTEKDESPSLEPPALVPSAAASSLASEKAARDAALVQAEPVPPPPAENNKRFYKKLWFWSSVVGALALGGAAAWWYTRPTAETPPSTYGAQRVLP